MMDELFKQKTGLTSANNTNIMSGIELGRDESEKRIKELEESNAKMLWACKSAYDVFKALGFVEDGSQILEQLEQAIKEAEG